MYNVRDIHMSRFDTKCTAWCFEPSLNPGENLAPLSLFPSILSSLPPSITHSLLLLSYIPTYVLYNVPHFFTILLTEIAQLIDDGATAPTRVKLEGLTWVYKIILKIYNYYTSIIIPFTFSKKM